MGTPTRVRHYRSHLPPNEPEVDSNKTASSSKNEVSSSLKTSPSKEASSSSFGPPSASHTTTQAHAPNPLNNNNISRRSFALTPAKAGAASAPSSNSPISRHERTQSVESSHSKSSNASSSTSSVGNLSYASVVASKGEKGKQSTIERTATSPTSGRNLLLSSTPGPSNNETTSIGDAPSSRRYERQTERDSFHSSFSPAHANEGFQTSDWMTYSASSPSPAKHESGSVQQHPIVSTPVKAAGYTSWDLPQGTSSSSSCRLSNNVFSTPGWTGSPAYFAPFAPHHGSEGYNSNNGSYFPSPVGNFSSSSSAPLRPNAGVQSTLTPQGGNGQHLHSPTNRQNYPDPRGDSFYSSVYSSNAVGCAGNGNYVSSSSPFKWTPSYNSPHSRIHTQTSDIINTTNNDNSNDTRTRDSVGTSTFNEGNSFSSSSSYDRSFNTADGGVDTSADTSASIHGHGYGRPGVPPHSYDSPFKIARRVSDDGSLYSFDGLQELSSRSIETGDNSNEDQSFHPIQGGGEGNTSLAGISPLDLNEGRDDAGGRKEGPSTSRIGGDGRVYLSEREQSDLDKLCQKLNLQAGDQAFSTMHQDAARSTSINANTSAQASHNLQPDALEDTNFAKHVRDAYKDVKFVNSDNEQTRYLFVAGFPTPDEEEGQQSLVTEITEAIKIYGQLRGIYVRHLNYTGCLILSFHDSRHAVTCRNNILRDSRRNPAWGYRQLSADFIEREQVVKLAEGKFSTSFLSLGEGKLVLSASPTFQYDGLKAYFSALGDVKSFQTDPASSDQHLLNSNGKKTYLIEYFDDRCASRAWVDITQAENADLEIGWQDPSSLNAYTIQEDNATSNQVDLSQKHASSSARPPLPSAFPSYPEDRFQRYKKTAWSEISNTPSPVSSPLPDGFRSATSVPPTSISTSASSASGGTLQNTPLAHLGYVPNDPTRNNTAQWGLIRDDPVPDNNLIRFDRIMSGEDKRTSCILRNLPNRMTQLELMENLDEVVPREYDFIYLRFDFNSGSNCGYSFVNFVSSDALLRFWKARLGTFWDKDNSRKLCMGGMAAIQGKHALVERFRNSSVMDAKEEYQPKIFYSSGPMRGLPEPFPLSNNAMRKARSTYATGLYGLYGTRPKGGFKHVML